LNSDTAKAIVEAAHAAWNAGSVEGMLQKYVEDLVYVTNTGPEGRSLTFYGKEAFRARFEPIMGIVDAKTTVRHFRYDGNFARVRFDTHVRHRRTGLEMTGSYRQIIAFRGFQICRLEDFHDAAKMAAFWRLVEMASQPDKLSAEEG
jgi:ketosteroid isomerase-like protein